MSFCSYDLSGTEEEEEDGLTSHTLQSSSRSLDISENFSKSSIINWTSDEDSGEEIISSRRRVSRSNGLSSNDELEEDVKKIRTKRVRRVTLESDTDASEEVEEYVVDSSSSTASLDMSSGYECEATTSRRQLSSLINGNTYGTSSRKRSRSISKPKVAKRKSSKCSGARLSQSISEDELDDPTFELSDISDEVIPHGSSYGWKLRATATQLSAYYKSSIPAGSKRNKRLPQKPCTSATAKGKGKMPASSKGKQKKRRQNLISDPPAKKVQTTKGKGKGKAKKARKRHLLNMPSRPKRQVSLLSPTPEYKRSLLSGSVQVGGALTQEGTSSSSLDIVPDTPGKGISHPTPQSGIPYHARVLATTPTSSLRQYQAHHRAQAFARNPSSTSIWEPNLNLDRSIEELVRSHTKVPRDTWSSDEIEKRKSKKTRPRQLRYSSKMSR